MKIKSKKPVRTEEKKLDQKELRKVSGGVTKKKTTRKATKKKTTRKKTTTY